MPEDEIHVHIDSSEQDKDIPEVQPTVCPKCTGSNFDMGFGLAGGGFGPYTYCVDCGAVVHKTQEG